MDTDFISELELSVRASNALRGMGVTTRDQFMKLTREDVMSVKNIGRRTWGEVRDLQEHVRYHERRLSLPGRAEALIGELNALNLEKHGFFVIRDKGRLRLGRYAVAEDLDG
ncbi:hypothetical protein IB276_33195 [Ensifer sp. ENS04]|uniref:DNA-directed RNA polymerase subunit alpha C-terminal domain-containing protein n=1 Tax=Ensifer sp. ENS04 TaxID=2769281 RepID=UPI00177D8A1C|nr:DNA-directed RNA polymerase subunit alpha C-terminal domain-containing protein [Ensifer sp. ENS04]MBD9544304.1 hypothetical protein [Ensifer sp. ENS04]